jgi:hypothetical protein
MGTGGICQHGAALIMLYACAEFLVKRMIWKSGEKPGGWALVFQAVVLAIGLSLGFLGFGSWRLFGGLMAVVGMRLLADLALAGRSEGKYLEQFAFVQVMTIAMLLMAVHWAGPLELREWYADWVGRVNPVGIYAVITAYMFVIDGGARLVRGVLNKFPLLMQNVASLAQSGGENRGEWIGILERIITVTFVLTGNYTAVAFVLTAKSIARFKELDSKDFAEYYLLGTSTSVAIALLAGTIAKTPL